MAPVPAAEQFSEVLNFSKIEWTKTTVSWSCWIQNN